MNTLIPEVEDFVVGNGDIVAEIVVERTHTIVTAIDDTVVDGDIAVGIAKQDNIGVGAAGG